MPRPHELTPAEALMRRRPLEELDDRRAPTQKKTKPKSTSIWKEFAKLIPFFSKRIEEKDFKPKGRSHGHHNHHDHRPQHQRRGSAPDIGGTPYSRLQSGVHPDRARGKPLPRLPDEDEPLRRRKQDTVLMQRQAQIKAKMEKRYSAGEYDRPAVDDRHGRQHRQGHHRQGRSQSVDRYASAYPRRRH